MEDTYSVQETLISAFLFITYLIGTYLVLKKVGFKSLKSLIPIYGDYLLFREFQDKTTARKYLKIFIIAMAFLFIGTAVLLYADYDYFNYMYDETVPVSLIIIMCIGLAMIILFIVFYIRTFIMIVRRNYVISLRFQKGALMTVLMAFIPGPVLIYYALTQETIAKEKTIF